MIPLYLASPSSPFKPTRGLLAWNYDVFTLNGCLKCWVEFFVFYCLKDLLSGPVHRACHENWIPGLYPAHKDHHEASRSAHVFNSARLDFLDAFVEVGCVPYCAAILLWALGMPVTMHFGAMGMCALCDVNIHSVNPYSVLWWNPICDR